MRRELRPGQRALSCGVCDRTLLKGETAERYQSRDGEAFWVCPLCVGEALARGWSRASHPSGTPPRQPPSAVDGIASRNHPRPDAGAQPQARLGQNGGGISKAAPASDGPHRRGDGSPDRDRSAQASPRGAPGPYSTDVSSSEAARIAQAVGVFNESAHRGMVVGIARTLGRPWASAACVDGQAGRVAIVVAWELSWYEFRVDTDGHMVALVGRGDKLSELDESLRRWNLVSDADGRLSAEGW